MNGAYDLEGVIWHQHSNRLMKAILELWDTGTEIVDLGCGHNFYVSVLKYAGYHAVGVDMVDLGSKHFILEDVTLPNLRETLWDQLKLVLGRKNVLSLEVGEHIPHAMADTYLDNLTDFGGDVLMSWALPGQAGVGHINCQSLHWVMEKMNARGYEIDWQTSHNLRQAVVGDHCSWFQHTLMYFKPTRK